MKASIAPNGKKNIHPHTRIARMPLDISENNNGHLVLLLIARR